MKVLVILGHPSEKSFNHAIAETTLKKLMKNGYEVVFHDLYREQFDPILNTEEILKQGIYNDLIKTHCFELKESDGLIIIHPNWWGQPPAILKGWIDRVFRPGIAYEFRENDQGEGVPIGLLKARTGIIFNTSNTSEKREIDVFKDPLETIWKNCIFDLCGIKNFYRKVFRIIVISNERERTAWLKEVDCIIEKYFPKIEHCH
jgi:putative NADPH-quinone reductase